MNKFKSYQDAACQVVRDAATHIVGGDAFRASNQMCRLIRRATQATVGLHLTSFYVTMTNTRARRDWLADVAPDHIKLLVLASYDGAERLTMTWRGVTIVRHTDGRLEARSAHEPDTADLTAAVAKTDSRRTRRRLRT